MLSFGSLFEHTDKKVYGQTCIWMRKSKESGSSFEVRSFSSGGQEKERNMDLLSTCLCRLSAYIVENIYSFVTKAVYRIKQY
jgi:hypothetical protein